MSGKKILKFPHCVFPIRLPRAVDLNPDFKTKVNFNSLTSFLELLQYNPHPVHQEKKSYKIGQKVGKSTRNASTLKLKSMKMVNVGAKDVSLER